MESAYLTRRLAATLRAARSARDRTAVLAHEALARAYRVRLYRLDALSASAKSDAGSTASPGAETKAKTPTA